MPDVYRINTSSAVSITASTQKTVLGYNAPSTCRPKVKRWGAASDAGAATDASVLMRLMRSTTAGTSTSVTPNAKDPAGPSAQGTAGENYTAEPTLTTEIDKLRLPTAGGGAFDDRVPQGDEARIAASGRVAVVCTPGAQGRSIDAWLEVEE